MKALFQQPQCSPARPVAQTRSGEALGGNVWLSSGYNLAGSHDHGAGRTDHRLFPGMRVTVDERLADFCRRREKP